MLGTGDRQTIMPSLGLIGAAGLSLLIWIYLLAFHGGFWRGRERLAHAAAQPDSWPSVVAVIPARNEADVIGDALESVLGQDYPGALYVVLVDDHSDDGTAAAAWQRAEALGRADRLTIVESRPLPAGWAGKVWALSEGVAAIPGLDRDAELLWFTDADIAHVPDALHRMTAKARTERLDLVTVMALLSCAGFWERLLIPPFVFFFQKLYPFAWSNDPKRRTAAGAGGCMLLSRAALEEAGGLAAIKGALIDDCALARAIKAVARNHGRRTWIGLTDSARSIRPYEGLGGIWQMVARTAFTQLRYSSLLLIGTLAGMVVTYLVAPLVVITAPWHGSLIATIVALATWGLMAVAAWPTFRLYRQAPWRTALLPLAASLYTAMTLSSALRYWRGQGGTWKGRHQAQATART